MKFKYQIVSIAVILRDLIDVRYINKEHEMLVDIADYLYNVNLGPENLKPEYKKLYEAYGEEFWNNVIEDASAIDSQLNGHEDDLILDYADYLSGAISPYDRA